MQKRTQICWRGGIICVCVQTLYHVHAPMRYNGNDFVSTDFDWWKDPKVMKTGLWQKYRQDFGGLVLKIQRAPLGRISRLPEQPCWLCESDLDVSRWHLLLKKIDMIFLLLLSDYDCDAHTFCQYKAILQWFSFRFLRDKGTCNNIVAI